MRLAALALGFALLLQPLASHAETIQLEQRGGVYFLPVRINDAVTVPFILDSGASEIAIPADVFSVLKRTGTISQADFLGTGHYRIASGEAVSSDRYTLHKISVGDHFVVTDVVANVVPSGGEPLLGQSFLQKLPAWTLDNAKHALVLHDGTENQTGAQSPPQPARESDTISALICGQYVPAQSGSTVLVGSWQRAKAPPLCAGIVA